MSSKFCPECGTKAPSIAAKFCSSCGTSLDIFASAKNTSHAKRTTQASYEGDEDDSDVTELPNISSLKYKIASDSEFGIGGNSFVFGKNGLEPTKMTSPSR